MACSAELDSATVIQDRYLVIEAGDHQVDIRHQCMSWFPVLKGVPFGDCHFVHMLTPKSSVDYINPMGVAGRPPGRLQDTDSCKKENVLMKTIMTLSFLQLAMLAGLTYKMFFVEEPPHERSVQEAVISAEVSPLAAAEPVTTSRDEPGFDENRLRQIIRSELKAHTENSVEVAQEDPVQAAKVNPVENALRLDVVKQELTYYIQVGEISDLEMHKLQMEISRLDPENRTLMLRKLVQALNSGELKGQL